jgi:integrase
MGLCVYHTPSGSWRAEVSVRGQRLTKTFARQRDAKAWAAGILDKSRGGKLASPQTATVTAVIDGWLASAAFAKLAPKTREVYTYLVTNHITSGIGAMRLVDLRPAAIEEWYASLSLAPATVRKINTVLADAMHWAMRKGVADYSPFADVDVPAVVRRERRIATPGEILAIIDATRGQQVYALAILAGMGGLRIGEVCNLRWRDVDFDGGSVFVRRAKTAAGVRTVTMPAVAIQWLSELHAQDAAHRLRTRAASDYVIHQRDGSPVTPNTLGGNFRRFLARHRLPALSPHALRHAHLSHLAAMGEHPAIIAQRAGQTSYATTMRYYTHYTPEPHRLVAQRLDDVFASAADSLQPVTRHAAI